MGTHGYCRKALRCRCFDLGISEITFRADQKDRVIACFVYVSDMLFASFRAMRNETTAW